MSNSKRVYFKNLDIVRFIAAISVVFAHGFEAWKDFYIRFNHTPEYNERFFSGSFEYLNRFFMNLGIGVEVFFFISGFLITYILLVEKERFGKISIWRFFIRRSLRIWPLYFLLMALGPFFTNWMNVGEPDYLSNALFYGNFQVIMSQSFQFPFAHYWSIALEEQFYVVWPFVVSFFKKIRLPYIFIGLIILSALSRAYYTWYSDIGWYHLYLNTLCRMDTLIIGALIAWYYHKKQFTFKLPKGVPTILILGLLTSFCFEAYNEWIGVFSAVFKKYIYLAIFGALILDYVLNDRYSSTHFFKRKITYLGKISYGIYMYHNILVIIVIKAILLNNKIDSWVAYGFVYVGTVILMSIISFELYEKWFLRLKERFAQVQTRKF